MPQKKLHNVKTRALSKNLRKNQTPEEKKLWYEFLNKLPVKFLRQVRIDDYIVDFYCASKKIIIEIDGCQHYWEENEPKDKLRDEHLSNLGFSVLRYSNLQINSNFKSVCDDIYSKLGLEY